MLIAVNQPNCFQHAHCDITLKFDKGFSFMIFIYRNDRSQRKLINVSVSIKVRVLSKCPGPPFLCIVTIGCLQISPKGNGFFLVSIGYFHFVDTRSNWLIRVDEKS